MAKISLTVIDINTIITKLTSSSDMIEKTWNSIKTEEIEKSKHYGYVMIVMPM